MSYLKSLCTAAAVTIVFGCGGAKTAPDSNGELAETPAQSRVAFEEPEYPSVDIQFEKFVLDNGLTVIVHEDPKTPVVAVNVWYHVGSKDEQPGKTGFAHLFEHLMFQGSENFKGEFFEPLQQAGATDLNGTTNNDRTNYFETVPTPALDVALWMESDRMGHFEGAISQELLDEQRGVVQNEKRQGQNRPYGKAWETIAPNTYPQGHPYSWTVIGSMEDLDAASLDDVKGWFAEYYGARNAVVTLAGDITVEEAKQKMQKFFGDIAPGPATPKQGPWTAKMTERREMTIFDRVPQERAYYVYNIPPYGEQTVEELRLAASVLGKGKNSRLYRRLVYDDQLATNVYTFVAEREIGSQLFLVADARPDVPLEKAEQAMQEELARFLKEGPTSDELIRAKMTYFSDRVSGLEKVGGFGGKSDVLAQHEVFFGDPGAFRRIDDYIRTAHPEDVREAAAEWLDGGVFVLRVLPEAQRQAGAATADRSKVPDPGDPPALELPKIQRAKLSNGIEVVLAERHDVPLVRVAARFDVGFTYDAQHALGTASFAADLMDEGTENRSALELSAELERLGADLSASTSLVDTIVSMKSLKTTLEPSLDLFAEVVKNPSFPEEEIERQRKRRLASIEQEKAQAFSNARRLLGPLLYGEGHPYAQPLTGSGTIDSVSRISRDDLVGFHQAVVHPKRAQILVVGDTTLAEIQPLLEARFGSWESSATPAPPAEGAAQKPERVKVYLIDKPRAEQSLIIAGHVIGPRDNETQLKLEALNDVVGGTFMARLNMNLREDKHWSYGARTFVFESPIDQAFAGYAQVQTDKTAESMVEIKRELSDIRGPRPATDAEMQRTIDQQTRTLAGNNETASRVLSNMLEIVRYGYADDYWDTYVDRVATLTKAEVQTLAETLITPDKLTWVVIGDLSQIEEKVRALGFGDVQVLDQDGRPVGSR